MYSGKKIIKAGEILVKEEFFTDEYRSALDVLSYWRLSHEEALSKALSKIEPIAKKRDPHIYTAKRLKRSESIRAKLKRFSGMKLKNMQDIGGCRIVVSNEKKLRQIVRDLGKLKEFKSKSNRKLRRDDYIKRPQSDGYRSYHMVGLFKNEKEEDRRIEVQIRTRIQHYWATALEIVDLFTGQELKIGSGRKDWKAFFINVSKQFSLMENIFQFEEKSYSDKHHAYTQQLNQSRSDFDSFEKTKQLARKLNALDKFGAFASSIKVFDELDLATDKDYVLIRIDTKKRYIEPKFFDLDSADLAEAEYIKTEKESAGKSHIFVALVSTNAIGGVKTAYPNFFADSTKFVEYLTLVTETALIDKDNFWNRFIRNYKA